MLQLLNVLDQLRPLKLVLVLISICGKYREKLGRTFVDFLKWMQSKESATLNFHSVTDVKNNAATPA